MLQTDPQNEGIVESILNSNPCPDLSNLAQKYL